MTPVAALHRKAAELGKLVVRMTAKAGSGHPSSALSLAHIVSELMYRQMRYDPADPSHPGADRLVLSEGHAVPIVYAAYADLGGAVGRPTDKHTDSQTLSVSEVDTLRERNSVLDGHPNPAEGFPFFDAATGSLGQGLSVAAGLGLAARLDKSDRRIFAICGDGESREGQIWEALDFLVDHKLVNVCAVFNCNGHGQAGLVSLQQSAERLMAKLAAFGLTVVMVDGHDPEAVARAFEQADGSHPTAVVARTLKGWGVAELLKGNWHGKPLKESDLDAAGKSLDATVAALTPGASADKLAGPTLPARAKSSFAPRPDPAKTRWPTFADAMRAGGFGAALDRGQLATRRAYGATLKVAGDLLPQVVCLDADVSNSTFSEIFAKAHPARLFECKIAEQNMVSVAAGLSAAGMIPFVNSFAKFIARAYDQVELANISRANVKIVGSHSGITPCSDGPSQMALADVAFFRAFTTVRADDRRSPLCWVFQPADAVAAYACTKLMIGQRGMCYMRTFRPDVPLLYAPDATFEPGGFHTHGSGDALALISAGYMVHEAKRTVELLAKQGYRATLIDCYSLPIDADRLAEAIGRCGRRALVVEDNYGGGVGSAVAEIAAASSCGRVELAHVQRYPKSTRLEDEELEYCGVSAAQIADHALALIRA